MIPKPRILVTAGVRAEAAALPGPRVRPRRAELHLSERIVTHLRAAGAHVFVLPPGDPDILDALPFEGAVITGGAFDIHPRHYGQAVKGRLDGVDDARTVLELALARRCLDQGIPLLGLCGGMQAMAVATGGSLHQDIASDCPGAGEHEQPSDPAEGWHPVEAWGPLSGLVGERVNSTHHQAVASPGTLSVCAKAPDGIVEGVFQPGHPFAVGVQWHPEWLDGRLFAALVAHCDGPTR